jgi:hypothetical protein
MKFADVTASSPNRQKKCPRGNQISPVEMLLQVFPYVVAWAQNSNEDRPMIRTAALLSLSISKTIPLMSALMWRIQGKEYARIVHSISSMVGAASGPSLGRTNCGNLICFRCSAVSRNIETDGLPLSGDILASTISAAAFASPIPICRVQSGRWGLTATAVGV